MRFQKSKTYDLGSDENPERGRTASKDSVAYSPSSGRRSFGKIIMLSVAERKNSGGGFLHNKKFTGGKVEDLDIKPALALVRQARDILVKVWRKDHTSKVSLWLIALNGILQDEYLDQLIPKPKSTGEPNVKE